MNFGTLFAEVMGLSTFIFAAVAQLKQFGIQGKALTYSAFGTGLVVGGAYRFFVYAPQTPLEWFWLALFGVAGGFVATGVYKGIESATGKNQPQYHVTYSNTGSTSGIVFDPTVGGGTFDPSNYSADDIVGPR